MRQFRADLHIHTVLSPCASVEMIPPLIVAEALERKINLIAITDHNASANVPAVQKAAAGTGLTVLPGMELQTREEVHLLCLFDTLNQLTAWQDLVDRALPDAENRPDFFGEQFIVDETGDFIRRENRLLINSTNMGIEAAVAGVTSLGGLAVPAHVDRSAFSLIANLGFIPLHLPVEAVEISRHTNPEAACRSYPGLGRYPLIQNGDAHYLDDILGINEFIIEEACLTEIRLALAQKSGRSFRINLGKF